MTPNNKDMQTQFMESNMSIEEFFSQKLNFPTFQEKLDYYKEYNDKQSNIKKSNFFKRNFEYILGFPLALSVNLYMTSKIEWYIYFIPGIIMTIGFILISRWIKESIFS